MLFTPSLQGLGIVLLHVVAEVDGFLLLFSLSLHLHLVFTRLGVAHYSKGNNTPDDDAWNNAAWNRLHLRLALPFPKPLRAQCLPGWSVL